MNKILITGASGFIGRALFRHLQSRGAHVVGMSRRATDDFPYVLGDLEVAESLLTACAGVDTIFHCAGFAHAFSQNQTELAQRHHRVNFLGTQSLLHAARECGVQRFVFLSSVKAMGEPGRQCVDETWPVLPESAYGQAKRAAEVLVSQAHRDCGMHTVNLRLAMVYGPGSRGNLERMFQLVKRGIFPPLPETGNRRSLVHIRDVVDVLTLTATNPLAAGETFIVAHEKAFSGRELYDAMRLALGKEPLHWGVPYPFLCGGAWLGDALGILARHPMPLNGEVLSRLLGSAHYSAAKLQRVLGWQAQTSLSAGLAELTPSIP